MAIQCRNSGGIASHLQDKQRERNKKKKQTKSKEVWVHGKGMLKYPTNAEGWIA